MRNFQLPLVCRLLFSWYVFIFISTEILSLFHQITRVNLILVNLIFFASIFFIYKNEFFKLFTNIRISSKLFLFIGLILTLTFIQGLMSAPSTTDSMVYHITRVMYWIQDSTLHQDFIRNPHDFTPPFGEYTLLHLYLLYGGDRILFLSQWLAFAASVFLTYLIANNLGASERGKRYILLIVVTLPIVVMEASSTQTDMVTTVFLLLSLYFALNLKGNTSFTTIVALGISLGLGMLTKTTFFIFAIIPVGVLFLGRLKSLKKNVFVVSLVLLIAAVLQIRFVNQNVRLYGSPFGQQLFGGGGTFVNEVVDSRVMISNLIRNTMINVPIPIFTKNAEEVINNLHNLINISINDPKTTFENTKFHVLPVIYPQEDIVSNPFQLLLIVVAGLYLAKKIIGGQSVTPVVKLYILTLLSFLIFSMILKWQPFHPRLLLPFFMIGIISSVIILSQHQKFQYFLTTLVAVSIPLSLLLIIFNVSRPYISYGMFYHRVKSLAPPLSSVPGSFFTRPRVKQYFNARPYWYEPYKQAISMVSLQGNIQLISFDLVDGFEYPLWVMLKERDILFKVVQLNKVREVDVILSTSDSPIEKEGYQTQCFKTTVDYGYACLSKKPDI